MRTARLFIALCLLALSLPTLAGTPKLNNLLPVAGQRGQTVDVTFYGDRLHDVSEVLFHTPGIQASELVNHEKDESRRVHAKFTIPADAPLGEHQVRLVTKTGVTEMITFRVVDRPIVSEQRDEATKNGKKFKQATSFENPQIIELGKMVLGRTEEEDVDYFALDLKQGQSIVAEVIGIRLGRGFTDSTLTMLDDRGREVASNDDTLLYRQDPVLSFIAPRDGRYVLTLRDSGYLGSNNNWYLLNVDQGIAPRQVFPLGGQPGENLSVRLIGDVGGDFSQDITLPAQANNNHEFIAEYKGLRSLSGLPMRVNDLKNVIENLQQPNNSINDAKNLEAHTLPAAFNGIIEKPRDHDFFKFVLKKGEQVTLKCYARSMGSPLDSVINVFNAADNKHLQGNDDQGGSDSVVTLTAPQDGEYYVRVRDHRDRGSKEFVYRVEASVAQPGLATAMTQYDRNRPQDRQAIAVPQGNRTAALVTVQRSRINGDVTPAMDDLPAGVTFKGLGPAQQGNLMPVVFEAAPDSAIGAKLSSIKVAGKPNDDSAEQVIGRFNQVTPLVTANPNRTEYYSSPLDTLPVVVTERIPFKVEVVQPKAPLVHGGKQRLQIKLTRDEGYEEQVRLYLLYRPPGMGAPGQVSINKTDTEGVYEVDANGSTPTRDWPMAIVANANQKGGAVWASSQLFDIKVEEPFVRGMIDGAKAEQGQAVDIVVELEHPRDWQGQGELKLLGLPAQAEADPVTIKPGQEKATLKIRVSDKTPPGNHKSLMCELTIQVNGEPVIHRFGQGGRLRVIRPGQDNAQARSQGGK